MERFDAFRVQRPGFRNQPFKHVVVSPPSSTYKWPIAVLRNHAYRVALKAGFRGGICIFHPFRWRCSLCGLDDEACRCTVPIGTWYASPHFHLLGHGWIEGTAELYNESGWVVVNLGSQTHGRPRSVYRTLQYQLSHAGVWMRPQGEGEAQGRMLPLAKGRGSKKLAITWFGTMSYRALPVVHERVRELCPECGRELVILTTNGELGEPPLGMDPFEGWWVDESTFDRLSSAHRWDEGWPLKLGIFS
jgi:hypothetical protein